MIAISLSLACTGRFAAQLVQLSNLLATFLIENLKLPTVFNRQVPENVTKGFEHATLFVRGGEALSSLFHHGYDWPRRIAVNEHCAKIAT